MGSVPAIIDFRYHLVSIIAVFVALAVGIVLGSGPLKEPIDNTLRQRYEQVEQDREALRADVGETEARIDYLNDAAETFTPALVEGLLDGRTVVLISMPGVDGTLVDETRDALVLAGATVSGTIAVSDAYADPERLAELQTILDELTPEGSEIPANARPYVRAGAVLADAVISDAPGASDTPDAAAEALLAELQEAGFLTAEGSPATGAQLAVTVAPVPPETAPDGEDADTSEHLEIVLAADRLAVGTVASGPIGSARESGLIRAVRSNDEAEGGVSTVDTLDTVAGRTSVVLALAGQVENLTGHYGIGEQADAIVPELPAQLPPEQSGDVPVVDGATPAAEGP